MAATGHKRLLVGQETVWATAVPVTAKVMGVTDLEFQIVHEDYQSPQLGSLAPSNLTATVARSGSATVGMDVSYEDIMFLFSALDTATISGSFTHAYQPPATTAGAFKSETLVLDHGTIASEFTLAGAIATGVDITGAAGGVWKATQEYLGIPLVFGSGTTAPADRVVELIRFADTELYVDTEAGVSGATNVPAVLIDFAFHVETNRHLKFFGGSVAPQDYGVAPWAGTLTITVEVTTATAAYVTALLGATQVKRQIRIRGMSGTSAASIDFSGKLLAGPFALYGDRDGNMTYQFVFQGVDNTTLGTWWKATITNGVATLP